MEVGKEDEKITLWKGCDLLKKGFKTCSESSPPKKRVWKPAPCPGPKNNFPLKNKNQRPRQQWRVDARVQRLIPSLGNAALHLQHLGPALVLVGVCAVLYVLVNTQHRRVLTNRISSCSSHAVNARWFWAHVGWVTLCIVFTATAIHCYPVYLKEQIG